MEGIKDIARIPIKELMKYLGVPVLCDRQKMVKSIKDNVKNTCAT